MLEAYLDDSGTHDGSAVVVWGGVFGHKLVLDRLDTAWRAQLLNPCDGKPPIKKFRSYDLEHGDGEFQGYNQGERDLTRRNFRQIIVNSRAGVLAYGISIKDWDQLARVAKPKLRDSTAEHVAFGKVIAEISTVAKDADAALSLQFDQGRDSETLRTIVCGEAAKAESDGRFLSYGFSPVSQILALQAADLVAYEAYRIFVDRLKDPNSALRLHAQQMFENPLAGAARWMGRKEIKAALRDFERHHKRIGKSMKKSLGR